MYKIIASLIVVLLLTGCSGSKEETQSQKSVSNVSQERTQSQNISSSDSTKDNTTSNKKEEYRKLLEEAKLKQEEYIQSLSEEERSNVQSALSAMMNKGIELQQKNPKDQALIEEIILELSKGSVEQSTEISVASISEIIQKYEKTQGIKFLEATPATMRNYYHLATPDQALGNAYLDNQQIALQITDEYQLGQGDVYVVRGCYVSEKGTELILFVEREQQKLVLNSTSEPVDDKVNLSITTDEILNEYIKY